MKQLLPAVLAALSVAACAGDYQPYLTRGLTPAAPEARDRFTLERTACSGSCPVYVVEVDERDILQFQGERHVAETDGVVGKRLPDGAFASLIDIARSYGFESFDAAYPNQEASTCAASAEDAPRVIVAFEGRRLDHKVSVDRRCLGPADSAERFDDMIQAMEAVLDISDLIGPDEDSDVDAPPGSAE